MNSYIMIYANDLLEKYTELENFGIVHRFILDEMLESFIVLG